MAVEGGSRFAHFLQPIRDLSKVWKIEIADELDKYIEELGHIQINNPADHISSLNFAEAALLIQGSTAVYGRKVELLYTLIYQALDLLSSEKFDGKGPKRGRPVQSGLWAPIPETDELLTVDHLIKEGRNIVLEEQSLTAREASQRRVPLFLMPRDQADRRKKEFRISTCTVHHSGAYLLQESDAALLDDLLAQRFPEMRQENDGPLVPMPPREVHDLDKRIQELLKELPDEESGPGMEPEKEEEQAQREEKEEKKAESDDERAPNRGSFMQTPMRAETPGPGATPGAPTPMADPQTPGAALGSKALGSALVPGFGNGDGKGGKALVDPWALLDDHATSVKDQPQEVGKTGLRLNHKRLNVKTEDLPDHAASLEMSHEALWSGSATAAAVGPMITAGHPVENLFLTVAGQLKGGNRYATQKAGYCAALLEFEDVLGQAQAKRRAAKMTARVSRWGAGEEVVDGALQCGGDGADSDGEESVAGAIEDCGEAPASGTPPPAVPLDMLSPQPHTPQRTPDAAPDLTAEKEPVLDAFAEQRKQVAHLENMIEDAQRNYESTIRAHLAKMQKDSHNFAQKGMSDLYANVRKWQDHLEPRLRESDSRPEFDMFGYAERCLAKLSDMKKASEPGQEKAPIPFRKLVAGCPRWEVCRRFLTTLILTNQDYTDLMYDGEAERLNNFSIKLLKSEREMIALKQDVEKATCMSPTLAAKLKKQAAVEKAADGGEPAADPEPPTRKAKQGKPAVEEEAPAKRARISKAQEPVTAAEEPRASGGESRQRLTSKRAAPVAAAPEAAPAAEHRPAKRLQGKVSSAGGRA